MLEAKKLSGFMTAAELAKYLKCSQSKAYSIIHIINKEEKEKGHLTICGRVSVLLLARRFGLIDE